MSYQTTGRVHGSDRSHLPAVLIALRAIPGCEAEPEHMEQGWQVRCTFTGLETPADTWATMRLTREAVESARSAYRDAGVT